MDDFKRKRKNLWVRNVFFGHGNSGPILQLRTDKFFTKRFGSLPDTEKKALYELLAQGDRDAIRKEVESIYEAIAYTASPH
jgi:hypothetical protein